jgi:Uncharacterized conserved protein
MSGDKQVEIERKYDVDDVTPVPNPVGIGTVALVEAPETIELDATYFDTPGLDLAHRATALRRREGGKDAGWHIKRADDEGRIEQHWPLRSDDGSRVPCEVHSEVAAIVGDAELRPVARVRNRRVVSRLLDAAGYPVAELCDDHVIADDLLSGTTRTWREWEIELLAAAPDTRSGRTALLDALEASVLEAGGRVSSSSSKLARTLGVDG